MCIMCIEIERGRLTAIEALRNYTEMVEGMDPEHGVEVSEKLIEKYEDEFAELFADLFSKVSLVG